MRALYIGSVQLAEGGPQAVTGHIANMTLTVGMHVLQLHSGIIHAARPLVSGCHPGL